MVDLQTVSDLENASNALLAEIRESRTLRYRLVRAGQRLRGKPARCTEGLVQQLGDLSRQLAGHELHYDASGTLVGVTPAR
jgi:hypothetical protein